MMWIRRFEQSSRRSFRPHVTVSDPVAWRWFSVVRSGLVSRLASREASFVEVDARVGPDVLPVAIAEQGASRRLGQSHSDRRRCLIPRQIDLLNGDCPARFEVSSGPTYYNIRG
jgi:hypothetical protein